MPGLTTGLTTLPPFTPILLGIALIALSAAFNLWRMKRSRPDLLPSPRAFRHQLLPPIALVAAALVTDLELLLLGIDRRDGVDLLALGANYLPRTIEEPWRLLSSIALHADLASFTVSAFALVALGRALVASVGSLVLLYVFGFSALAGSIAASTLDSQAVTAGLAPAVAGLAGAWFVLSFDRDLRFRAGSPTLAAATLHLGYFLLEPSGTNFAGLAGGLLSGMVAISAIVLIPVHTVLARAAATALLAAVLVHWFARLPQPPDRLGFFVRIQESSRAMAHMLIDLQKQHAEHELDNAEFARRIETDALAGVRLNLEAVDALQVQNTSQETDPLLAAKRSELEFQRISLEILRDVHAARDILLTAETMQDNSHDSADIQLDTFWEISYPQLTADRERLQEFNASFSNTRIADAIAALRRGLDDDLALLTESAVELEIKQTENWLMLVRTQVLAPTERVLASEPSSSMNALSTRVDSRLRRISSVASRLPFRNERLDGLQNHLNHILSSIR